MKRILNNIGAISKQAIVGSAIGVATLIVGIGLMNNFTGGSDTEQGFASNAIERSGYNYDSSYSGVSAEDILSARNSAQNEGGKVSSITGTEDLALAGQPSSTKIQGPGNIDNSYVQEEDSQADSSRSYGAGVLEGMGTSENMKAEVAKEDEAAAQAQRNAKIAAGKELGAQARASLKTSKIADGSGIKGIENSSTSMTYGNLGSSSAAARAGSKDSSKISLDQAAKYNADMKAAQAGKLSSMGNNSMEAPGAKIGRAANGQTYASIGDLGRASKYSRSAKNAVGSDSALGAADAAAAFDGSKEAEAVSLEGDNLQQAAVNALDNMGSPDMNFDFGDLGDYFTGVNETMEKYADLIDKTIDCIYGMLLIVSAVSLAVAAFAKVPKWGQMAALITAAVGTALLFIPAGIMAGYFSQIADLAAESGIDSIKPTAWDYASPWVYSSIGAGLIWASFGIGQINPKSAAASMLSKGVVGLGGSGAMGAITHFLGRLIKKK